MVWDFGNEAKGSGSDSSSLFAPEQKILLTPAGSRQRVMMMGGAIFADASAISIFPDG